MKYQTVEQRQAVYEQALSRFMDGISHSYMCFELEALIDHDEEFFNCDSYDHFIEETFPELWAQRPVPSKGIYVDAWFPTNKEGRQCRIDCLLAAIEVCKKSQKVL